MAELCGVAEARTVAGEDRERGVGGRSWNCKTIHELLWEFGEEVP